MFSVASQRDRCHIVHTLYVFLGCVHGKDKIEYYFETAINNGSRQFHRIAGTEGGNKQYFISGLIIILKRYLVPYGYL